MENIREQNIFLIDKKGKPSLIGSKCLGCDHMSFPAKEVCPYCMTNGRSEEILIGKLGIVVSATTCHTAPKGIQVPYTLGTIEIDYGVHVLAQITGNTIRKGDKVELVIYSSVSVESAEETIGWKYQIVEGGGQ